MPTAPGRVASSGGIPRISSYNLVFWSQMPASERPVADQARAGGLSKLFPDGLGLCVRVSIVLIADSTQKQWSHSSKTVTVGMNAIV